MGNKNVLRQSCELTFLSVDFYTLSAEELQDLGWYGLTLYNYAVTDVQSLKVILSIWGAVEG